MFARVHQPGLYDQIHRILVRAGIVLTPSQSISSPAELQYQVKSGKEFTLVPESTTLDPELTMRSITGINLSVKTAFICNSTQMRPVLPMLAYRVEKCCSTALKMDGLKRPNGRATGDSPSTIKKTA